MATPILSVERVDILENDSGSGGEVITFRVNMSEASDEAVTFGYRTFSGTANANDFWRGYTETNFGDSHVGTIAAGQTSTLISLKTNGDTLDEVDESFFVELFNPMKAVLDGGGAALRALGVIQDNDGSGSNLSLFVEDAAVKEGNGGTRIATFKVHLSRPHDSDVTLSYKTVDGTAKAGSDYVAKTGTITFAAGQTETTVEVAVRGDGVFEGNEQFLLVVKPSAEIKNGTIASTGRATILNDDTINETLNGTAARNTIRAGDGNDTVYGLGGNDKLYGESGNDKLFGGLGDDTLAGGAGRDTLAGGAGRDTLAGGADKDKFVFDSALSAKTNVDVIVGFSAKDDTFVLENSIFKGVSAGAKGVMKAGLFKDLDVKNAKRDVDDRIIYDRSSGNVFYDADGSGKKAGVLFAQVADDTVLTAADFLVI